MSEAKIHPGLGNHPKFRKLSDAALGVWTRGLSWVAEKASNGRISARAARVKGFPDNLIQELVDARLWDVAPDGDGWVFHDYLDWNPPRPLVSMKAPPNERYDSTDLANDFSRLRQAVGGGSFRKKHSEYQLMQDVLEWAEAEHPAAPRAVCLDSMDRYFRFADNWTKSHGWSFSCWARDPGRWLALKAPVGVVDASRPERSDDIGYAYAYKDLTPKRAANGGG